jgi:uncharacterized protein YjbJ (UPF0337 family)
MTKSGPREAVEGVMEEVKGKVKEAAGALEGDDRLRREGEAQEDKAAAQRDVAKREAQADSSRAAARGYEAEEKAHQRR